MQVSANHLVITGGGGWLGGALLRAYRDGISGLGNLRIPRDNLRIRALALTDADERRLREIDTDIEVIRGDLRDPDICRRLCRDAAGAVLFHLAGLVHARRAADFISVNYAATKNILAAACGSNLRRAVVMSSNSPLGCNPTSDHQFDERSPYHPYMKYGRSKMLMELHARDVHNSGQIETVIVRSPWLYGLYQPPRQTLFFEMIRDGTVPIVGTGDNRRSMGYTENVAQGLILAANAACAAGETYWIADERAYSMNEIIDTVERLLESEFDILCRHRRVRLPGIVSQIAQGVDWALQSLGAYHQKIHVLSEMNKTIACSVDKAKRELGYEPQIALEEGMRRSLRWCLDEGLLGPAEG